LTLNLIMLFVCNDLDHSSLQSLNISIFIAYIECYRVNCL